MTLFFYNSIISEKILKGRGAMFIEFNGKKPRVAEGAYISPTAVLIGDVTIEEGASIWFGAVLRGDFGRIVVGKNSSVQDNCRCV